MGEIKYLKDSDGVDHFMYKQDESTSCALACMFVIENSIKMSTNHGGEPRIKAVSATAPGSLAESQKDGGKGGGTSLENIMITARQVGVRITKYEDYNTYFEDAEFDKSRIYDGRPALVAIRWRSGFMNLVPQGGHAVVATRINSKGQIVILDPWEPSIHEIQAAGGRYRGHGYIMAIFYTG